MRRSETVRARVNEMEYEAVQALVELEGRTNISEMLRELIRRAAIERGVWPTALQVAADSVQRIAEEWQDEIARYQGATKEEV